MELILLADSLLKYPNQKDILLEKTHLDGHKYVHELNSILDNADETFSNDDLHALKKLLRQVKQYLKYKRHSIIVQIMLDEIESLSLSQESTLKRYRRHLFFPRRIPRFFFRKCFLRHMFCRRWLHEMSFFK